MRNGCANSSPDILNMGNSKLLLMVEGLVSKLVLSGSVFFKDDLRNALRQWKTYFASDESM